MFRPKYELKDNSSRQFALIDLRELGIMFNRRFNERMEDTRNKWRKALSVVSLSPGFSVLSYLFPKFQKMQV